MRFGRQVFAPVVEKGCCDLLVAFEELEGLRWVDHLRAGGRVILNRQRIDPMPVISGKAEYPEEIPEIIRLQAGSGELVDLNALAIAEECGSLRTVNTVLLGLAARFLPVEEEVWLEALAEVAPARMLEMNRQAFLRDTGTPPLRASGKGSHIRIIRVMSLERQAPGSPYRSVFPQPAQSRRPFSAGRRWC